MKNANNNVNKLICGDNLEELAKLPKESVDLIYIDPPFFTHKQYEVIWGDEAEIRSFEDRWAGGIEHYIDWIRPRVQAMYEVLKPTGSFYLHCDWHASAHLRLMLDEIFGKENFRNEIIWCYKTREFSKRYWNRKHDTIHFFVKGNNYTFNWDVDGVIESYSPNTIAKYRYKDKKGYYRLCGRGITGSPIKSAKDVDPKWEKTHPELVVRNYLGKGYPPPDHWYIDIINQVAKERLGYPTQKPLMLLEKIIAASSNKGDIILDAFCGCGTALIAAQKLGRHWIGIDISPTAIRVVEKERLSKELKLERDKDYIVAGMPTKAVDLKKLKPFEFQNWIINEMRARHSRKKVGDMGLDGYVAQDLYHEEAGIQVKQSENVGRNVIDNFETALERAKYKKGYIIAFSFGKGAYEEVARLKNTGKLQIELVTVEDLLYKKKPLG
jgi:DNA modification methylase